MLFFRYSKLDFVFFREGFDWVKGQLDSVKIHFRGCPDGLFSFKCLIFVHVDLRTAFQPADRLVLQVL